MHQKCVSNLLRKHMMWSAVRLILTSLEANNRSGEGHDYIKDTST